jgi:hypothetical protein
MFSNLRIWWAGWRRDYEHWWVRARRQGDSQDLLNQLKISGFVDEACICISSKADCLRLDNLAADREEEQDVSDEVLFASTRVGKASDYQDQLSPRFRGSFWRHLKRQTEYVSMGVGTLQVSGADHKNMDDQPVMIYIGLDSQIWVRPLTEFLDGRFVCINGDPIVKYGLVGAGGYAENNSAIDGGSPATTESPTQES